MSVFMLNDFMLSILAEFRYDVCLCAVRLYAVLLCSVTTMSVFMMSFAMLSG
jgi:hypothetical protein